VSKTNEKLIREWMTDCFDGDEDTAKLEIATTLSRRENQINRSSNFLLRLISNDECGYQTRYKVYQARVNLALAFVRAMSCDIENKAYWNELILTTLMQSYDHGSASASGQQNVLQENESSCRAGEQASGDTAELSTSSSHADRQASDGVALYDLCISTRRKHNGLLHEAARHGRCQDLKTFLISESNVNVNTLNSLGETALHLAAEFQHVKDVEILLEAGARLNADRRNCTPLHSAAMAINPSHEIANRLVEAMRNQYPLDEIWKNWINKQTDEMYGNNTALHIAAGNANVSAEFIDKLAEADPRIQNKKADTAFHVAAKSTNDNTIMNMLDTFCPSNVGWDVDEVDERREYDDAPLLHLCAITGKSDAVALLIQHGADISKGVLHELVIESVRAPGNVDKLSEVYRTIVDNVVTWRCLEEGRKGLIKGSPSYNKFLRETLVWLLTYPDHKYKQDVIQCAIEYGASHLLLEILNTRGVFRMEKHHVIMYDVTNFTESTRAERHKQLSRPQEIVERDFWTSFRPRVPYISDLLANFDHWRDTDILDTRPIRELSTPYICIVKRCYLFIALLQLLYMALFSHQYLPSTFSLSPMFNQTTWTSLNSSDGGNTTTAHQARPSWLWLLWPMILTSASGVVFLYKSYQITVQHCTRSLMGCTSFKKRTTIEHWPTKFLLACWQIFPVVGFAGSIYAWFRAAGVSSDFSSYANTVSMVFLFGWLTNLIFFSGITKQFYVFALVLQEIMIKDIVSSFMLIFAFTVVAFSFALHTLRLKVFPSDGSGSFVKTVFDVLAATLGVGDFFVDTISERAERGMHFGLLEAVFLCYLCFTVLILLNVLIAMMSYRYDTAKRRAENAWRLHMLQIGLVLEKCDYIRRLIRRLLKTDFDSIVYRCGCGVCLYCKRSVRGRVSEEYGGYILEAINFTCDK